MKNIFLLPTTPNDETAGGIWIPKTRDWCNIYITSSDEEIKEGDYAYYMAGFMVQKDQLGINVSTLKAHKKIILTTDQELIKDGVQEIDNEFLEWFVNNPNCEQVDVSLMNKGYNKPEDYPYQEHYIINIPKEEVKQETLEEAAKNITKKYINEREKQTAYLEFVEGAKWQAEKMYSKEEVLKLLNKREDYINSVDDFFEYQSNEEWFKQNKKKV